MMVRSATRDGGGIRLAGPVLPGQVGPEDVERLVMRPRLHRLLDEAVRGPLTTVIGPAGTGKTALLATWARTSPNLPGPAATLHLGETHDDLHHLGTRLAAALIQVSGGGDRNRGPSDQLPEALADCQDCLLSRLVSVHVKAAGAVVLILDGVQGLRPGLARRAVLRLLRHPPTGAHIVVSGRTEPEVGLHRMRVSGAVREVRAAELAFTQGEALELFAGEDVTHTETEVAELLTCSGGWAVALRAVAVARADGEPWHACAASGTRAGRLCSDFLERELLDRMTPEQREVMLAVSVTDTLTPSLVRGLTGRDDAWGTLRRLSSEADLLLECGPDRYRHHPLLRNVLDHELSVRIGPERVAHLKRRAELWHVERRYRSEAPRTVRKGTWPQLVASGTTVAGRPVHRSGPGPDRASGQEPVAVPPAECMGERLTATEVEVLRLLPDIVTLAEIAAERNVSVNTVKSQVKGIYRKLGARRRREAVETARRQGLL